MWSVNFEGGTGLPKTTFLLPWNRPGHTLVACTAHQTVEPYRVVSGTLDEHGRCVQCATRGIAVRGAARRAAQGALFDAEAPAPQDDGWLAHVEATGPPPDEGEWGPRS